MEPYKCASCGTEEPRQFETGIDDECVSCGEVRDEIEREEATAEHADPEPGDILPDPDFDPEPYDFGGES